MIGTYKVWLEQSVKEWNDSLERYYDEEGFDMALLDEPYWARLRFILASLDTQGVMYEVSLDREGDRFYALVTTMPPLAHQLTLEDLNVG